MAGEGLPVPTSGSTFHETNKQPIFPKGKKSPNAGKGGGKVGGKGR